MNFLGKLAPVLLLPLSGCILGPDYERPEMRLDLPGYRATPTGESDGSPAATVESPYKAGWNDPVLVSLLADAAASNLTIRAAFSRLEQSRATLAETRAAFWPTVGVSGSGTRRRAYDPDATASSYAGDLSAGWELDIFGKNRRLSEISEQEYLRAGLSVEDAQQAVASEIALDYIQYRYAQADLALALETLDTLEATAKIAHARKASGFVAGSEADAADASIATARADIPAKQAAVSVAKRALEQLCALPPFALDERLASVSGIPQAAVPPRDLPANLLSRRPDVRQAECTLHAATAQIGVARAARYPSIDLSAGAAVSAAALSSWSAALKSLSFGGSVALPLFRGGALRAAEKRAQAEAEEALLGFHDIVLQAVHEAQNNWTEWASLAARRGELEKAVEASRRAYEAAVSLYEAGKVDYTDVVSRQSAYISARAARLNQEAQYASQTVRLAKSLGFSVD